MIYLFFFPGADCKRKNMKRTRTRQRHESFKRPTDARFYFHVKWAERKKSAQTGNILVHRRSSNTFWFDVFFYFLMRHWRNVLPEGSLRGTGSVFIFMFQTASPSLHTSFLLGSLNTWLFSGENIYSSSCFRCSVLLPACIDGERLILLKNYNSACSPLLWLWLSIFNDLLWNPEA